MIRTHHYCDVCGKQISYVDADGEVCIEGIVGTAMQVDVYIRTDSGQSTSRHAMCASEYCGYDCFESRLSPVARAVSKQCDKMKEPK